jgi:5-methyltetrahydrofolate--homocysteine methyltransferase
MGEMTDRDAARRALLAELEALARVRILILDGAMGTMIQTHALTEADFRGTRFADWDRSLKGNNDLLNLTRPDIVADIHRAYVEAGADLIETNTFSATSIAMADYGMEAIAPEIAAEGARLAREVADAAGRPVGVMGAIGPTNKTLSLSPKVTDPGYRDVTFDQVRDTYHAQVEAMAPFVDIFLIETVFDTLNAKAAVKAVLDWRAETGGDIPLAISGTITDAAGRTLSGQTPEAFWVSLAHAKPWAVGLNCALGAKEMRRHIVAMAKIADTRILAYPNAGLPNAFGGYDETPEETSGHLGEWALSGMVNVVGGCCGTTPEHIAAIARAVAGQTPRAVPEAAERMRLSGLEAFEVG